MARTAGSNIDVTVAEQRRAQILRAVMASIAEDGLERTTMRAVARRAGVSTGTIAYYFQSKQEMMEAALLKASREFMACFEVQRSAQGAPPSLDDLVETFLAPENAGAGFLLEMVAAGLHNPRLRSVHQRMIEAGEADIEAALRRGMEGGRYRSDVDPELAAALFHGVLLWWGSELMAHATSQDKARRVGRLALFLLQASSPSPEAQPGGRELGALGSTLDRIRSLLRADAEISPAAAEALADAVERLYSAVRRAREDEAS